MSADSVIAVHRSRLVMWLSLSAATLVAASLIVDFVALYTGHDRVFGLTPLFDIDLEANVPTFFSAGLLLAASGLLGLVAHLVGLARAGDRIHWRVLACILLFMAVDEASQIHELASGPMHFAVRGLSPAFRFAWVIPAMVLTLVVAASYLRFFFRLPMRTRVGFALAAAVYVTGAIGMELVGGAYLGGRPFARDAIYILIFTTEESLELIGVILLINSLLAHIESEFPQGRWRVVSRTRN